MIMLQAASRDRAGLVAGSSAAPGAIFAQAHRAQAAV